MSKKVLIAVGDTTYTKILKNLFQQHSESFILASQEIYHRRFLNEIVPLERPDILIIHDYYLPSDFTSTEEKEAELLSYLRDFRLKYEDELRIVYLCERPNDDPLLATLVSIGVKDIFNSNSIELDKFIEQLKNKAKFSNVERFLGTVPSPLPVAINTEEEDEDKENKEKQGEKLTTEKSSKKKVVEKKVVNKVVQKQVIKRDYQIHITKNTEKVVGVPIQNKLILIGGFLPRSGSTLIAHILAKALADMNIPTTYIESPFSKAYTYDRFAGHQAVMNYRSKFYQFNNQNEDDISFEHDWEKDKVHLICKHPEEPIYKEQDITFESLFKVFYSTKSIITIVDVGTDWHYELYRELFDIAEHIYIVVEPDVSSIQYFEESQSEHVHLLRRLLDESEKTFMIGNRFDTKTLENPLINELYGSYMQTTFPVFPTKDVFEAQYKGIFLNDLNGYKKYIEPYVKPFFADVLPSEFIKKVNKKNLFKDLFKRKISVQMKESKGDSSLS